ncbi:Eco57I restriction-modification methylase domain-containing protein [Thermoproteota archaeon]
MVNDELRKQEDEDKSRALHEIKKLIDKYMVKVNQKKVNEYNEEMTKKDFITPMFRALGWDIENSNEVTAEENISKKRVDYSFRLNGIPKFFLEAKSLKENLEKPGFFQQAVNYAWHKGCAWAVLTNFKHLKILNAEWKSANPFHAQFGQTLMCEKFDEQFDQLWLLSKKAFKHSLLDKEAEKWGKKRRNIPIDKQLLADFTRYRELLSKNVAKLNQPMKLTEEDLDESIQRILDRLIFIRNCEDKELEEKVLISNFRVWKSAGRGQLVKRLRNVFEYFDKEYNSKIFSPHLCDELDVDNEVLHEIIQGLYFTKDKTISYDFSAIDADVLGTIYEQYLSHVLSKTAKRARLTDNQVHRKLQGIYYTPTYIVEYIVKNVIGELTKNNEIEKIRILDPACGSGSFLIKTFDVLNKYRKQKDDNYSQTQLDLETGAFSSKVEIIKNNIFGIDLDRQAVEIAQLNLLLKLAEKSKRLPLLGKNIKCGNSLINDNAIADDKAFDWDQEFPEIIKGGGFDIVIGNPPYIRNTELPDEDKTFYNQEYDSAYKQYDIYILFFELGIELLRNGGYLGFITSNKFLASDYGQKLREFMLNNCRIISLIDVSYLKIFKDASTYPVITILSKDNDEERRKINLIKFQKIEEIEDLFSEKNVVKIKQSEFMAKSDNRLLEELAGTKFNLIRKIDSNSIKVKDLFMCKRGTQKNKLKIINKKTENSLEAVVSRDVNHYFYKISDEEFVISDHQKNILHLTKILLPRTVLSLEAAYDSGGTFIMDRIYYLIPKKECNFDLKYVTAVLNSKLIDFYYKINFGTTHVGGGYLDLRGTQIKELPIKIINAENQQEFIGLIDRILDLGKKLDNIGEKKTDESVRIKEEIEKLDEKINMFVYDLYGVTESEKRIIENSI